MGDGAVSLEVKWWEFIIYKIPTLQDVPQYTRSVKPMFCSVDGSN